MVVDRRKKGCPNELCKMHKKMIKQNQDKDYCQSCGSKLIFVCSKCFREIRDEGSEHRICDLCLADSKQKRREVKVQAEKASKFVLKLATPVVLVIFDKVVKKGQDGAVDLVVNKFGKLAKDVLRK